MFHDHINYAVEPAEIEIALWFHAGIYSIKTPDNEVCSADWAMSELTKAGVQSERALRVAGYILATKHSALPQGQDQQLLVDIYLAILGAGSCGFAESDQQSSLGNFGISNAQNRMGG